MSGRKGGMSTSPHLSYLLKLLLRIAFSTGRWLRFHARGIIARIFLPKTSVH